MVKTFYAFFLLACLCSSVSSYQGTMFTPLESPDASWWLDSTATAVLPSPPQAQLIYDCPLQKTLRDFSSRDIIQELWERGCNDARQTSLEVMQNLRNFLTSGVRQLRAGLGSLLHTLFQLIAYLWSSLIWASACAVWHLLREYTIEMLSLASLYMCTVYMVKTAAWIFGDLPIFLLKAGLSAASGISRVLWFKGNYKAEKSVEGFLSFKIPQTPPGKSVLQVQHQDGSHAGYATCVALFNGSTGLITAHHVITPGAKIVSTRNGSKIPASEFQIKLENSKRDLILMTGPPNWEGALACKASQIQTANNLCKSKATFFAWNGEDWESSNAEIVGVSACRNYVSVLSNTNPGHSGTPYFNGKTLLGVHIGGANDENANYLAPIPAVPGLTSPKYVFETTAPQGRLFNDEEITALVEEFSMSEVASIMRARKGKQVYVEEAAPKQGKRRRGGDRANNRPTLSHPGQRRKQYKRNINNCCSFFTEGTLAPRTIASHEHEPWNDEKPRCFCAIPGHDCFFRNFIGNQERNTGENKPPVNREAGCGSLDEEGHEESRKEATKRQAEDFQRFFDSQYTWEPGSGKEAPGFKQVGRLPEFYHPKQKTGSKWGAKICRQHPEMDAYTQGFGWPQFGAQAELKSLRLQAARWLERAQSVKIPSSEERERVIRKCCEAYRNAKTIGPNATRGDSLSWEGFLEDFKQAVFSLEFDAGIGVPYIAYGRPTHRGWVEDPKLLPILARLTFNRLQKMLEVRFEHLSPAELVQAGLCDPIRVFVKGEPHKQSKLDEGRYRLIMSVSLIDQLVARVLFQNQNKREITLWRAVPSKPGFGLSTDEQVVEFMEILSAQVGVAPKELIGNWQHHLIATDCSGFDWSVSDWLLEDDMEVRNRLTLDINETTKRLRSAWLKCISNSVLSLSDGTLLSQQVPGVQKSGSYNTSSSNSRIRVMAAYHCGAEWAMAMGDDALESVGSNLAKYAELGFKVEVSSKLEFCSHIFEREDLAIPVNKAKMIYKLIHGYEPECGNAEVLINYLTACFAVLNELRSDPQLVSTLHQWLVLPVQPQKI
ncbi:P1-P2 fusion protein [Melon aphid-borne yellows virus]|uniref:p1-P2 fusion protein n=1 Tax=Melon aphid-borne yellows virus TaxID=471717 RepID=B3FGT3_9VIRU|nr:P1-P2 fusion protein [Melon aphid-borne yellows virus]